jgi:hypothetical protein
MRPVAIMINGEDQVGFACAEKEIGKELTEKTLHGQTGDDEPWPIYDTDLSEVGDYCENCHDPLYFCNRR